LNFSRTHEFSLAGHVLLIFRRRSRSPQSLLPPSSWDLEPATGHRLLRHTKLATNSRYLQVRREVFAELKGLLEVIEINPLIKPAAST